MSYHPEGLHAVTTRANNIRHEPGLGHSGSGSHGAAGTVRVSSVPLPAPSPAPASPSPSIAPPPLPVPGGLYACATRGGTPSPPDRSELSLDLSEMLSRRLDISAANALDTDAASASRGGILLFLFLLLLPFPFPFPLPLPLSLLLLLRLLSRCRRRSPSRPSPLLLPPPLALVLLVMVLPSISPRYMMPLPTRVVIVALLLLMLLMLVVVVVVIAGWPEGVCTHAAAFSRCHRREEEEGSTDGSGAAPVSMARRWREGVTGRAIGSPKSRWGRGVSVGGLRFGGVVVEFRRRQRGNRTRNRQTSRRAVPPRTLPMTMPLVASTERGASRWRFGRDMTGIGRLDMAASVLLRRVEDAAIAGQVGKGTAVEASRYIRCWF